MNTRSFPSFATGLLPSIVPSLSATPASKKRGAEDSASSSASSNESHTDISKNLVPWVPNKCRAVAGPQQKEIDRERSTRRRLEERLTLLERQRNSMSIENGRLRALDVARRRDLGELSRLLDYQNNVNSKETERQELLIALREAQQKISSMEESLEQWEGLVEVCNSTIAELNGSMQQVVVEKEEVIAQFCNLKQCSDVIAAEAKKIAADMDAQNKILHKMRVQRDEARLEKDAFETEIQRLRRREKPLCTRNDSTPLCAVQSTLAAIDPDVNMEVDDNFSCTTSMESILGENHHPIMVIVTNQRSIRFCTSDSFFLST
ncbi:hypothetical protein K435DRAFT_872248 [Dendrothele bispora CBS 962.96]|uniref:Uncharacterized protein n=1 Tax=Dendrothele bispora (strain CBS 962.96) TaxID=1314807 RepID=A0A4S8L235_DENBC|nr:hypothetical protein K435DRAFT_872248 [Dendrothele bispora CBS 962.96]